RVFRPVRGVAPVGDQGRDEEGGAGYVDEVVAAGGVPLGEHGRAAAALVIFHVNGVQARGETDRILNERHTLEVVIVDDQVAVDVQDAAVVAAGAEGDGDRVRAGARNKDVTEPAALDVVIVAGDVVIGRAQVIPEAIGGDVGEVDRPRQDRGGGGRLVAQPAGIAGVGGRAHGVGAAGVVVVADP